MKVRQNQSVVRVPGNPGALRGSRANGYALSATILKTPKKKEADERPARAWQVD